MSSRQRTSSFNDMSMSFGFTDFSTSPSVTPGLQGFSLPPDPYSPANSLSGTDSNSSGSYSSGKPTFSPSPFGRPPSRGSDRSFSSSNGSGRGSSMPFGQSRGSSRSFNPSQMGGGGGTSSVSSQPASTAPAAPRRRGQAQLPTDIPNENEYMLRQAHETGNFGPTSLPPQPYSGQSPFDKPKQTPPKILQSQMDYLDDVNRRVNTVDDKTQRIVQERGQRAIQNATLPGLEPVQASRFRQQGAYSTFAGGAGTTSPLPQDRKRRFSGSFQARR